ncbi:MAG: NUDIX hydrolase [Myxococcales bacterium]|nr:NUDIX hydrolase [Myxococcota bacterium]MDW8283815.1 NUDIX hydrolase [Myxococcales bacterium]
MPDSSPLPTVDVIIELVSEAGEPGPAIVLVERRFPPLGWALPGGFVEVGEPLWQAAQREAQEETGLVVELVEQFFTYSDPGRDPRRHTISTVFVGRARGQPCPGDDAGRVGVFRETQLPPLAFDHGQILQDYFLWRRSGRRPPAVR